MSPLSGNWRELERIASDKIGELVSQFEKVILCWIVGAAWLHDLNWQTVITVSTACTDWSSSSQVVSSLEKISQSSVKMCHFKKHTKQEMEGRKSHDNFLSKLFAGTLCAEHFQREYWNVQIISEWESTSSLVLSGPTLSAAVHGVVIIQSYHYNWYGLTICLLVVIVM